MLTRGRVLYSFPARGSTNRKIVPSFSEELNCTLPPRICSPNRFIINVPIPQVKGYPFEVAVEGAANIRGVILADQVKSLGWQVRKAEKKGKVTKAVRGKYGK